MIRQVIDIDGKWTVIVYYILNYNRFKYIADDLQSLKFGNDYSENNDIDEESDKEYSENKNIEKEGSENYLNLYINKNEKKYK